MRIHLSSPLKVGEIASALGSRDINIHYKKQIEYITTDTRELIHGDLFIPIKGEHFDGEDFVCKAISLGAYTVSERESAAHIKVPKSTKIISSLANYYRRKKLTPQHIIGITGSVGKTTTKEFLKIICEVKNKTHATTGNFNNTIGLPMTLLSAPKDSEIIVCEMGMNRKGEISELSKTALPTLSIITKIGTAHIGRLGSREAIAEAKLEILDGMSDKKLIAPYGEPLLGEFASLTFSTSEPAADLYLHNHSNIVTAFWGGEKILESVFKPHGKHNAECLCAAIGAALAIGIEPKHIKLGVSLISEENTRQSLFKIGNISILDDAYNSSEDSVKADLKMLFEDNNYKYKSAVLGAVLELGEHSYEIHRRIGCSAAKAGLSNLFLVGEETKAVADGAIGSGFPKENIHYNPDENSLSETALAIKNRCNAGEMILLKGSHRLRLWRLVQELKIIYGE